MDLFKNFQNWLNNEEYLQNFSRISKKIKEITGTSGITKSLTHHKSSVKTHEKKCSFWFSVFSGSSMRNSWIFIKSWVKNGCWITDDNFILSIGSEHLRYFRQTSRKSASAGTSSVIKKKNLQNPSLFSRIYVWIPKTNLHFSASKLPQLEHQKHTDRWQQDSLEYPIWQCLPPERFPFHTCKS